MRFPQSIAHALPLNDELFKESFYVTHAGWERVTPNQSYPRPGHPSYYQFKWDEGRVLGEFCLMFLLRGEGEVQTKQGRQSVRAGHGVLYQPGEWHRHRPISKTGWFILWINFNGSLAQRWMHEGNFRLHKNLVQIGDRKLFEKQLRHLVESIHAAGGRNTRVYSWQAIGLLSHFLADPSTPKPLETNRSGDSIADAAMDFIWSQSHNQIGVADVARHVNVGRRTLERRFRNATGSTLLNEIQRCRISRAALLLSETDVPVKYVVGRAGFASYQRLRQVFRKHFKLSPQKYRNSRSSSAVNG